jgi:hypothetical protein
VTERWPSVQLSTALTIVLKRGSNYTQTRKGA